MDDRTTSNEPQSPQLVTFDAILPPAMALRAEETGVKRVATDPLTRFILSILAGAFIAFGAIFATTVMAGGIEVTAADGAWAGSARLPYGIVRLLGGLAFSLGLILVVIGGAELFTGNNLIVMAWASHKVRTRDLLQNWVVAFAGNFVGAFTTAVLVFLFDTIHLWRRLHRPDRINDRSCKNVAGVHACGDARHLVQCAGMSGHLDVLRRAHQHRSNLDNNSSGRRLCGGRLRAQYCKYLLHLDRLTYQVGRSRIILERGREISR
jgi:Formate/nitrite transporter